MCKKGNTRGKDCQMTVMDILPFVVDCCEHCAIQLVPSHINDTLYEGGAIELRWGWNIVVKQSETFHDYYSIILRMSTTEEVGFTVHKDNTGEIRRAVAYLVTQAVSTKARQWR